MGNVNRESSIVKKGGSSSKGDSLIIYIHDSRLTIHDSRFTIHPAPGTPRIYVR
ncbi:MAG TPA: hypothetical protein VJU86_10020 [Pyrinomonadaceae bacterium]|nr:hypothetical protein [Pyrinomonadaceae bacterium]